MKLLSLAQEWQGLLGSFIGASAPFLLWWFSEIYRRSKKRKDFLYYLERLLVDQINITNEARETINFFVNKRLKDLIINIGSSSDEAYVVDYAFFPLFSVRPLCEDVQKVTTKSGYLDNKITQSYSMSEEIPLIISDLRQQFYHTQQINKEISFNRLNSSAFQKESHIKNIEGFREVVNRDLLEKTVPVYLKQLVQTRTALNHLTKIGIMRWCLLFDGSFSFYLNNSEYKKGKENIFKKIDIFFKEEVEKEIKNLNMIFTSDTQKTE